MKRSPRTRPPRFPAAATVTLIADGRTKPPVGTPYSMAKPAVPLDDLMPVAAVTPPGLPARPDGKRLQLMRRGPAAPFEATGAILSGTFLWQRL